VMTHLLGVSPRLAGGVVGQQGPLARVVMSLGAGVYEETVFRLGIMAGVAAVLQTVVGFARWIAVAVALAISALIFSAMHHIPPYGDPFSVGVFLFRALAGVFFGLLFYFRGFAVAVYTHALYDLYVLLVR
jgi:membrane protease YdiL (CAAX protease family)